MEPRVALLEPILPKPLQMKPFVRLALREAGPRCRQHQWMKEAKAVQQVVNEVKSPTPLPDTESANRWRSAVDASSNRTYYFNPKTRETTWEQPKGFKEPP
eukprot:516850_1